ncbi:hypothetical protein HYT92_02385 [Candidatus Pacearchaeota archaeon]|nr:hypothetical protein [Candidatus Pacearchaeota archaeon]
MKKQKNRCKARELKPGGKLRLKDCFNLTKAQEHEFIKAAREEREQKKKDFQVGGIFEIGRAGLKISYVRSLFSSLR